MSTELQGVVVIMFDGYAAISFARRGQPSTWRHVTRGKGNALAHRLNLLGWSHRNRYTGHGWTYTSPALSRKGVQF